MNEKMKADLSNEVIYFSRFHAICEAGGGCRRTAQIMADLEGLDVTFISSRDHSWDYRALPEYAEYLEWGGLPEEYAGNWQPGRLQDVAFQHFVSWSWSQELRRRGKLKLALVDDPLYFSPLVSYLSNAGIPVVALCHNIESLSRAQLQGQGQRKLLNLELSYIELCSLVVTISREETFLLRNLGINTLYHPYYPVTDVHERMLAIRNSRTSAGKDFLLVGTANNAPTMKGMQEVMQKWGSLNKSLAGARLFVAGYGSEPLEAFADGEKVIYKGVLSDADLDALLSDIGACIAYQEDGSGALTKICEFLVAGIPVLANSHAARSYYNVPGLVEFSGIGDLARATKLVKRVASDFSAVNPPDPGQLVGRLVSLCNVSHDAPLPCRLLGSISLIPAQVRKALGIAEKKPKGN